MLLLFLACKEAPTPVVRDEDDLYHYFWAEAETATDAELVAAVVEYDGLIKGSEMTEALTGAVSDLTPEEAALVDRDTDPSIAAGMLIKDPMVCDIAMMEKIIYWQHQDDLYSDYDEYQRDYTSDFDAYVARETNTLTWDTHYTASNVLTGAFASSVKGWMRWVDDPDSPVGPFFVYHAWIPEAAVFENPNPVFDQDYRVELYYTSGDHLVHAYPIWRHLDIGSGLNTDTPGFQNSILNELIGYDEDMVQLCADGGPQ